MNFEAIKAIYATEMSRTRRTLLQSVVSPVISTSLYFIVFGTAIGSRIEDIGGVSYGAFITPGLIMLTLLTQCISNGSFGIYFPKFTGTIYEILSAPIDLAEILIGYVGAAATKGLMIGTIILATSTLFVDISIAHPLMMILFFVLTAVTFSLFGFMIGIWARDFEQLRIDFLARVRSKDPDAAVEEWVSKQGPRLEQFRNLIDRARNEGSVSASMLAQIAAQARILLAR